MTPPGRFLKKNNITGEWEDVGDEVAREKASQALRDAVSAQIHFPRNVNSEHMDSVAQEHRRVWSAPAVVMEQSLAYANMTDMGYEREAHRRVASAPPNVMSLSSSDDVSGTAECPAMHQFTMNTSHLASSSFVPPPVSADTIHSASNVHYSRKRASPTSCISLKTDIIYTKHSEHREPEKVQLAAADKIKSSCECLLGDFHVDMDEFDLFDGDLLKDDFSSIPD